MAIIECFKHWRHYLEGSHHTIEVWSDHQNLQGFMKQPRINGRQARWLVYLTPYDFIIRHRPGLLNPADGPSRRPDYLAMAQKEPSTTQKDLLASKLVGSDSYLPKPRPGRSERPNTCQQIADKEAAGFQQIAEVEAAEYSLQEADEAGSGLSKIGLHKDARIGQPIQGPLLPKAKETAQVQLPGTAGALLCKHAVIYQSKLWLYELAEQQPEDSEAGHLLDMVKIQSVTRKEARRAVLDESPLVNKTAQSLLSKITELQGTDPLCVRIRKEISTKISINSSANASTKPSRDGYSLDQKGLLFYKGRVVVPTQKALTQELLYLYHDDQLAGHWGVNKTQELLERKFYWPGLARDVREYVATCSTCQNIATPRHKPYGKLESLPVPKGPWQEVSLDFITQLPSSYIGTRAYDAVLVVVDRYTKMARFIPTTTDVAAPEFAALFHENIELKYGSPYGIVSDRDTRITSKFWAEVCIYSLIKRRMSTAFHPQTDGQTEILNRILENYLRAYTSLEQMNWAKLLPSAEFAYNNSRNSSTKITPFMALYGYNPELRFDIADTVTAGEAPAARQRIVQLQDLRNRLQEELLHSQERQAKYYNQKHQPKLFKRGDLVKLSTRNLRLRDKKLQPRWVGPFRILERIGSQAYRLALPEKYARLHDVFPI